MATKLQWSFPPVFGNTPKTKDYRPAVELREGEDFIVKNDKIVMIRDEDGVSKVGMALFNDRWFADDYEFKDISGHLLEVEPTGGGERND